MGDTEQLTQDTTEIGLTDQPVAVENADSAGESDVSVTEPMIDVDGEQVKLDQIKQWRDGSMMQADYTRKTQDLARQRQEYQTAMQQIQQLQANQQFNGQEEDPVKLELAQHKQLLQHIVQETSMQKVNTMLDKIKGDPKYNGSFNSPAMEQALMATALHTGRTNFDDLKTVADELYKDISKMRLQEQKTAEKKTIANLTSPTRKGGEAGKGVVAPTKDFDPTKASWKEIRDRAKEYL